MGMRMRVVVSVCVSVCVSLFMVVVVIVVMVVPMVVPVSSQDDKAQQVGEEAGAAHDQDKLGVVDFGRFDEARQGFKNDGDAESNQEDGVEEGTENLGSNPPKGELVGCSFLRGNDRPQTDRQRDDIIQLGNN